jgi:hypothetical protein
MMDIPTIAYWMGVPISEMPREELEREFVAAHRRIQELERNICERSVEHIRDLAEMRLRKVA